MAVKYGTTDPDNIPGTSGNDIIYGWASSGNASSTSGNDTLNGAAGNDQLFGGTDSDSLTGGKGNDTLNGRGGSDIYRYTLGDGIDTIADDAWQSTSGTDHLIFTGAGLTAANAIVTRVSTTNDLLISFKNSVGSVTLEDQLRLDYAYGIERITFSNNVVWNEQQLLSNLDT